MQYWSLQHWIYFHHQMHPQLMFDPAPSFFLGLLEIFLCSSQQHTGHLPTWGTHVFASYLFAFLYSPWGSHGKNTGVVCHSLLPWAILSELSFMTCQPWVALPSMANSIIELHKSLHHYKAVVHEGEHFRCLQEKKKNPCQLPIRMFFAIAFADHFSMCSGVYSCHDSRGSRNPLLSK